MLNPETRIAFRLSNPVPCEDHGSNPDGAHCGGYERAERTEVFLWSA